MKLLITIDGPWHLDHRDKLTGRVFGCTKDALIQVLVQAADDKWYTQKAVLKGFGDPMGDGQPWECEIVLGYPSYTHPLYGVAAGIGGKKVLAPCVSNLPTDVLWEHTAVVRSDGLGDN